ncbi:YjbQ family protein [Candidatus Bathyarchaeota archaeon]|nr:YjbQ family protein [Candidatus Bathyarchaeota archaeon]
MFTRVHQPNRLNPARIRKHRQSHFQKRLNKAPKLSKPRFPNLKPKLNKDFRRQQDVTGFKVFNTTYTFQTKGEIEFVDLTDKVQEVVDRSGIKNGIVHVFAPHATGILILTENDYALLNDIKELLEKLAPKRGHYMHPFNAHSHLRSMLLPPDKTLPVINGRIEFGTWQSLLFVETDVHPRKRTIIIQVIGQE